LRSATMTAAEMLGMQEQIGSVEAGKFADIVAVAGNPLEDVNVLQKAKFVMKDGMIYKNER
jgi:imidazolonepropionase-like amidohydrolase